MNDRDYEALRGADALAARLQAKVPGGAAAAQRRMAEELLPRMGGIALKNGLVLVSEDYWAAAIREADGRYYASFVVQVAPTPLPQSAGGVGIDRDLTSKLANLLFIMEPQRRLGQARAQTIAVGAQPGVAHTNIGSQGPGISNRPSRIGLPFNRRSASGAPPLLRAATDLTVSGGQFYGPRWGAFGYPILETSSPQARNQAAAEALWSASGDLTGLDPSFGA